MRAVNEFLPTTPFDLYELHLLHLIARHGSFTGAAGEAGLTQSAMTRQVQGVEARLGVALFERTTRRVDVTPAGAFLLRESARVIGDLDAILQRFRNDFAGAPKEVRVGVSKTISMAYLPGFFAAQQRRRPEVRLRVVHLPSQSLMEQVETNALDLGILCPPRRIPQSLQVSHRFDDGFDLIVPASWATPTAALQKAERKWLPWLQAKPWLLIAENSDTGAQLRSWLRKRQWPSAGGMDADSFDLIINLVALGQGISVVPKRALAIYGRQRKILRFRIDGAFSRKIAVVTRKKPEPAPHVSDFIANILF